jgi:hypothetical protein
VAYRLFRRRVLKVCLEMEVSGWRAVQASDSCSWMYDCS